MINYGGDFMKELIEDILKNKNKIYAAFIFGSFGTDEFTSESDIDIAVIGDLDLMDMLTIEKELRDSLSREIDLVDMRELPQYLQLQITVRNEKVNLNNEEKYFEYLDTLNLWYKNEYPFWKKSMIERGHSFD